MIIILVILIFIIFLFCIINLKIKKIFEDKKLFIYNKKQYYIDNIIFYIFLICFILFFRIVRIFLKNTNSFDLKKICVIFNFDIFFKLLFLVMILFFIRKLLFFFVKVSFLRLHYYFFMRYALYENIFYFLVNFHLSFFKFIGRNRYIYFFISRLFKEFPKIILFFFLLSQYYLIILLCIRDLYQYIYYIILF